MIETRPHRGFLVFTLGALTGAAIAYLTAPRTGRESREALRRKAAGIPEGIREALERRRESDKTESYATSYHPELPRNER
ncbi:MAG TPA: YtxH domain-containing protein [Candidatus Polarisedimenticolaceae bacterium]|nr:YtxH domain-containing protein [Candidatus Polarisedimenticolaceae bacterium]